MSTRGKRKRPLREILAATSKRFGDQSVRLILQREIGVRFPTFWLAAEAFRAPVSGERWQPIPLSWSHRFNTHVADALVCELATTLGYEVTGYKENPAFRFSALLWTQPRPDGHVHLGIDNRAVVISRKGAARLLRALGDAVGWDITD